MTSGKRFASAVFVLLAGVLLVSGTRVLSQPTNPCSLQVVVPADQPALRADCEALWSFFNQLTEPGVLDDPFGPGGAAWGLKVDLGIWRGVTVEAGRVVALRFDPASLRFPAHEDRIAGPLSPVLSRLDQLKVLDLAYNRFTGEIPGELGLLSNLHSLNLTHNELTGSIPQEFGQLPVVRHLDISHNQLSGPIPGVLAELEGLRSFDVSYNQLVGPIPAELGQSSELVDLRLGHNQLTGSIPIELSSLRHLQELDLSQNRLTGRIPSELARLQSLSVLDLSNNYLVGPIPPELGELPLVGPDTASASAWPGSLDLSHNQLVGHVPLELGDFLRLWKLDLSHNQLTGPIPEELGNLHFWCHECVSVMDLSHNQLVSLPIELGQIEGLNDLDLSHNLVSGSIPLSLTQMTSLNTIDLSHNFISGEIPSGLDSLAYLESIDLSSNHLSGPIPVELGDLEYLRILKLRNNRLTGSIPPQLMRARDLLYCGRGKIPGVYWGNTGLMQLDLARNQLSGIIPPEIGQISNLGVLNLSDNRLMGSIPPELGRLKVLEVLDLSDNLLTGRIPKELAQITPQVLWTDDWCSNPSGLRSLSVVNNRPTGPIPTELTALTSLEMIDLSYNQLTGQIPAGFGMMPNLSSIDLRGNTLEGPWPESLALPPSSLTVHLPAPFGRAPIVGPRHVGVGETVSPAIGDLGSAPAIVRWRVLDPDMEESRRDGTTFAFNVYNKGRHTISVYAVDGDGATFAGVLAVDAFDVIEESEVIDGPRYGAAGFSSTYSVSSAGPPVELISWTAARDTHTEAVGSEAHFTFFPEEGASYVISVFVVRDGLAYSGTRTVEVFGDITDNIEEIVWLREQGITHGCATHSFCPDRVVTRGQMAVFLSRALDLPPAEMDHFDDDTDSAFEDPINRLAEAGIAHECEPHRFCHDEPMTRAELAGFMAGALNLSVGTGDDFYTDDAGSVFEYDINRLAETGLISGCTTSRFCPAGSLTRGEMAALLFRARGFIEEARRQTN